MAVIGTLTDSFPGTTVDVAKWGTYGAVALTGGLVSVGDATGSAGLNSIANYDLTGSALSVKVGRIATGAGNPVTNLVFSNPAIAGNSLRISVDTSTGLLSAEVQVGFADTGTPHNVTYNATNHAYLRIREAAGNVTFETSADGLAWATPLRTEPTSTVAWIISGGAHLSVDSAAATLSAQFASFNVLPAGGSKILTLNDQFGATLDPLIWGTTGTPAASTGAGILSIPTTTANGDIHSLARYDCVGSEISINVIRVATNTAVTAATNLVIDSGEPNTNARMQYDQSDLKLHCVRQLSGVASETALTYNAVTMTWWRMREAGGTFFFETSPSGAAGSWTVQRQEGTNLFVTSTGTSYLGSVAVFISVDNGVTGGVSAQFDNLNNLPTATVVVNPKIGTLQDNFNNLPDTNWIIDTPATLGANVTITGNGGDVHTATTYNLVGSLALVQVVGVATGSAAITNFVIDNPLVAGQSLRILRDTAGANLRFSIFSGFADDGTGAAHDVAYDAVAHAWWKIEEVSGSINFSTSPDSQVWTPRRTISTATDAPWVNNINVFLSVDASGALTTNAVFDNFNTPTVPTVGLVNPKAATLQDDFTGTTIDQATKWAVLGTGGVTENNALLIAPVSSEIRGIETKIAYDLQESNFVVQAVDSTTSGDEAVMRAFDATSGGGSNQALRITVGGGFITAGLYTGGVAPSNLGSVTWPVANSVWIRIRDSVGTTYFEYSSDGSFTDHPAITTITAPTWINNVKLQLYSDNTSTITPPITPPPSTAGFVPNTAATPGGTTVTADFRTANVLFPTAPIDKWSMGSCIGGTSELLGSPSNAATDALLDALGGIVWRLATTEWHAEAGETGPGGGPCLRRSINIAPSTVAKWIIARKGVVYPLLLAGSPGAPNNGKSDNDNGFTAADATAFIKYFNDNGAVNAGGVPIERMGIGNEPYCGNSAWDIAVAPYAVLFESCYQAVHSLYPNVTINGPSIGCLEPFPDGSATPTYIADFITNMGTGGRSTSHIGRLTWHAYDGSSRGLLTPQYLTANQHIQTSLPGHGSGCEEFNWASGGSDTSYKNFVFQVNVYGSCFKSNAHAYQFLFCGGMGLFSTSGAVQPSYWALAAYTGCTGTATKLRDTRGSFMVPSTNSGNVCVWAMSNGKMVVTNASTTTDAAITIGMGGTTSGKYDMWKAGQQSPQSTGFTHAITQAPYSAGTISITIPWGSVCIIELYA